MINNSDRKVREERIDKGRDVCFRVTSSHYVLLYWPVFSLSMLKLVPITCPRDIIPVTVKSEYI